MIADLPKPSELIKAENKPLFDYLYTLTESLNFVLNNLDTENISGLLASQIKGANATSQYVNSALNPNQLAQLVGPQVISEDGVVYLDTLTMICYGSAHSKNVTFKSMFGVAPILLTTPDYETTVTLNGFTVTPKVDDDEQELPISLTYIAIGRRP